MTAKEAIEILSAYYEAGDDRQNTAMDMAISALEAQESTHPEIIECKECQCFEIAKNEVNGFCTKHGICPDVYDYCSWAERKENGSD